MFYGGGTYGHVAICADESGVIFSTDLPKKGKVRARPLCAAACLGSGAPGRPCCCRRTRQGLGPHTARLHRRVRAATAPSLPRSVVTRLSSVTRRPRSQVLPERRRSGQTAQQLSKQRGRCCPRAPCAASSLNGVLERLGVEVGVVRGEVYPQRPPFSCPSSLIAVNGPNAHASAARPLDLKRKFPGIACCRQFVSAA